jgi:hypothetical protein
MIDEGDEELRRRFRELKAHDHRGARAFDAVLASARRPVNRPRRFSPVRRAAAAVLVIAAGAAALTVLRNRPRSEQVAISSWHSPTEWLLKVRPTSLDSVPEVTASVIRLDGTAVNTTSPHSGHSKGDTI